MIQRSILVGVPPGRAFRAWTEAIDLWWPPNHRISGAAQGTMVLEGGPGGRFFERTGDGREIPYGQVVTWQPPQRLDYDFYLGSGPDAPTRVEVRFEAVDKGTRIDIHHHRGQLAEEHWNSNVGGYQRAWKHLVEVITEHMESLK